MERLDLPQDVTQALYREVRWSLNRPDTDIFCSYDWEDIELVQRIRGPACFLYDSEYLRMQCTRQIRELQLYHAQHTSHRWSVVKEDTVLRAVNRLCDDHRKLLLKAVET